MCVYVYKYKRPSVQYMISHDDELHHPLANLKHVHFETPNITWSPTGSESVTLQSVARCHKWTGQLMDISIYLYIICMYVCIYIYIIGCIALQMWSDGI